MSWTRFAWIFRSCAVILEEKRLLGYRAPKDLVAKVDEIALIVRYYQNSSPQVSCLARRGFVAQS